MTIKVLLADDHRLIREGMRSILEMQPGIEVIGEAENGLAAVELARTSCPDVVVLDITMPVLNGFEASRRLLAENPDLKVIAVSMHSDRRMVVGMIKAGASGFLVKDAAATELVSAIRTVHAGNSYLSSRITGVILDEFKHPAPNDSETFAYPLSDREREVLQLLTEGEPTKAIADTLSLSVKTIETHRSKIMAKLDIHSVAELTKWAVRHGITSLDE